MLKDQINESCLRVNAAKFGHSIEEIAPQYTNSYYLPDKSQYVPEKQVCKGAKGRNGAARHHSQAQVQYSLVQDQRYANSGSRAADDPSRSINGGISISKHSRNHPAETSARMNLAKQAQVDFMNSKYLGQTAPFVEKQSSVFMTEASMM